MSSTHRNNCEVPIQPKNKQELSSSSYHPLISIRSHVQLLTHDDKIHPSKCIVPPETTVNGETINDLVIDNKYGFNPATKTILYPLQEIKCDPSQIRLKVYMFNEYKIKRMGKSNRAKGSVGNDQVVKNDLNDFINNELNKLCKLRICLCRRTEEGLERVSKFIDTNIIKEVKGSEELEAIDPSKITPTKPCECGKEQISVPLNTASERAGFIVIINGKHLALHEFVGVNQNAIKIYPPSKTPGTEYFDLTIEKRNVLKTINQNRNPYENPIVDLLLATRIKYADHNDNCQHGLPSKKRKRQ